jgi:hypothetical protein
MTAILSWLFSGAAWRTATGVRSGRRCEQPYAASGNSAAIEFSAAVIACSRWAGP